MLLMSCASAEERKHDELMDRIEKQVRMPNGAAPLNEYARFYSDYGNGLIMGSYVFPSVIAKESSQQCEELTSMTTSKRVPCASEDVRNVKAGERRWLPNQNELPGNDGRGCQVISVLFDQRSGRFEEVSCVIPVSY